MPVALTAPALSRGLAASFDGVKIVLRLEGLALLSAAVYVYATQGFGWGLFAVLFLAPDVTFAAYLLGPRIGAIAYNALHSTIGALALAVVAYALPVAVLQPVALIWLAHIGFDRLMGYGLKYASGFNDTHLGRVGR